MRRAKERAHWQTGVTLIELMIAMAIGLIMILALSRVYLSSAESARDAEAHSTLTDKMRLLQERFNYEFRRADFWGRVPADAERLGNLTLGSDCGGEFAFGRDATVSEDYQPLGVWASTIQPVGCNINDAVANQSYVVLRYAGDPCASDECDSPSLSSFYPSISFFIGTPPPLPERASANDHWQYEGSLYYLRRDSTLWRLRMSGSRLVNQEVLRGVEALAYRWHEATASGDGVWLVTSNLDPEQMQQIDGVEIEMVVSAETRATYHDARSYQLSDGRVVETKPGFLYRHFSFVVPLEMHRLENDNA
ncbi:prepilin-type N-terminal cleavage/methylation domain-containing protein [Salinicola corii]|uniref:Prepilin-type N-terminal cleavage/methylation domain-containing protein n=1 Tax=Salinicola corii TaxID=2606937 RepID=A0A640W9T9_9GAMM|nr:prepilin-type N-terminal cleavage/methylation domain-containing protein [Salinicola corii]KAA0016705.1 prepilin-type N-terminal cleavage/methylation domain-containing protein [Salinicola corii]